MSVLHINVTVLHYYMISLFYNSVTYYNINIDYIV